MLGDTEEITSRTLIWHRRRTTYHTQTYYTLISTLAQSFKNTPDTKSSLLKAFFPLSLPRTTPGNKRNLPIFKPVTHSPNTTRFPITGSRSLIVRTRLWYFPMYHPAAANSMHSQSTDIHIYSTSPVICYNSQLWEAFHQWSHARESYTHLAS